MSGLKCGMGGRAWSDWWAEKPSSAPVKLFAYLHNPAPKHPLPKLSSGKPNPVQQQSSLFLMASKVQWAFFMLLKAEFGKQGPNTELKAVLSYWWGRGSSNNSHRYRPTSLSAQNNTSTMSGAKDLDSSEQAGLGNRIQFLF